MSGTHSYLRIGEAPPTGESRSASQTPDSSALNHQSSSGSVYHSLLEIKPTRKSPTLIAIRPDSSISWTTASLQNNADVKPAVVVGCKNTLHSPPIAGSQVSVVQHVPSTNQGHCSGPPIGSESILQDIPGNNNLVTSSTSYSDLEELPSEPVNYREDVKLDDKALVIITTKELNRRLKKEGLSKARCKEIKSERRTLKNRGYASNCRVGREEEEKCLERDILQLQNEIDKYPPIEKLEEHYNQLRKDCKELKAMMNITDDSDESLSDLEIQPNVKEQDLTSTDPESEDEYN